MQDWAAQVLLDQEKLKEIGEVLNRLYDPNPAVKQGEVTPGFDSSGSVPRPVVFLPQNADLGEKSHLEEGEIEE